MKYLPHALVFLYLGIPTLFISTCIYENSQSGLKFQESGPINFGKIPNEAKNIDYYVPPAFGAVGYAEFDISYDGFKKWVRLWNEIKPELSEITIGNISPPLYSPEKNSFSSKELENVKVTRWDFEDESTVLAYDEENHRAYFYYYTR